MSRVLIATLGASPIVVTAMIDALATDGIDIEEVDVLYPYVATARLIDLGVDLIEECLNGRCHVVPCPLPFGDMLTETNQTEFLRVAYDVLQARQADEVYISVAGGRKNMGALLAIMTQFFSNVRGLYHLLDLAEDDPRRCAFHSIQDLFDQGDEVRAQWMRPPLSSLRLVRLPYQKLAGADALRAWLNGLATDDAIPISVEAESFFDQVFRRADTHPRLEVRLTRTAYEQLEAWAREGSAVFRRVVGVLGTMANPEQLRNPHRLHGGVTTPVDLRLHFFKPGSTDERPLFYTTPHDISGYPKRPVERLVLCGVSRHKNRPGGGWEYEPDIEYWLKRRDFEPYKRLQDLSHLPTVLIAPFGESPMVATQAFTLLRDSTNLDVRRIVAVYPNDDAPVREGARILEKLCQERKVSFQAEPIQGLADVASADDCRRYMAALQEVITRQRQTQPEQEIALLLSGGRKAMSVLAFFAAQAAGLERVYHTLITDPTLEQQIERECNLAALRKPSRDHAKRLFLEAYAARRGDFTLVPIPIIPLQPPHA